MVIVPQEGILKHLIESFSKLKELNHAVGDQEIIWSHYDTWPEQKNLHLPEKNHVFYEHLKFYLDKGYTLYKPNKDKNITTIHFVTPKPWLLKPVIRIKYVLYQLLRLNFSTARLLFDYFITLRKVEKYIVRD